MPTPMVRRPDFTRAWLSDLSPADFVVPDTSEHAQRTAMLFKRVMRSEALRALAGRQLTHGWDGHYVDLLIDETSSLEFGIYQSADRSDPVELRDVRIDPSSGTLYPFDSQPWLTGDEADTIGALLATPYSQALGHDLDTTLQELGEAFFWLGTLRSHLQDPSQLAPTTRDLSEEVRIGLAR